MGRIHGSYSHDVVAGAYSEQINSRCSWSPQEFAVLRSFTWRYRVYYAYRTIGEGGRQGHGSGSWVRGQDSQITDTDLGEVLRGVERWLLETPELKIVSIVPDSLRVVRHEAFA